MLRLLLACCPAAFRETYTRDIEELFEARRARLRGRPMRLLWLWLTTAGDLFLTAGAEWRGALAGHRAGVRLEDSPGRLPMTDRLMLDVRDAGRHLAAAPGFTVAAVVILALGIGSSTAIFSAVDAFALRSRPFARPTELVNIYQDSDDGRPESNSYPTYVDVSQYTDLFSGVGAVMPEGNGTLLTDSGDADFVQIEFATSSYFPVLGLQPRLGRWFTSDEDRPGVPPAAVLTHAAWQRRFGSDPGVIGRTIRVSGAAVTIVGVGPVRHNGFVAGLASDFWMSISALGPVGGAFRGATLTRRDDHWFQIVARLAPGRTAPEAQSTMNVLAERIGREFPDSDRGRKMTVMSAADVRVHPEIDAMIYPTAGLNLLLTALLLAIVCSNLANLMLARGSTRTRELAVRLAIGATRTQIIRSLVVESVLLALAGGAVGLALAWWAIGLIDNVELPLALPVKAFITLDYRVAAFAIGVSLLSGLAFGLLPAIRNSRRDLSDTLKIDSRAARGALRVADLRGLLIVVQIAISLALIACGGILLRSMLNAMRVDLGFDPKSVVAVTVDPMQAGRSAQQAMQTLLDLRERAASHPGVEFAALATRAPVTPFGPSNTIVLDEHAIHRTESGTVEVASAGVTPDYFRALRIGILYRPRVHTGRPHGRGSRRDRQRGDVPALLGKLGRRRTPLPPRRQRHAVDHDRRRRARRADRVSRGNAASVRLPPVRAGRIRPCGAGHPRQRRARRAHCRGTPGGACRRPADSAHATGADAGAHRSVAGGAARGRAPADRARPDGGSARVCGDLFGRGLQRRATAERNGRADGPRRHGAAGGGDGRPRDGAARHNRRRSGARARGIHRAGATEPADRHSTARRTDVRHSDCGSRRRGSDHGVVAGPARCGSQSGRSAARGMRTRIFADL